MREHARLLCGWVGERIGIPATLVIVVVTAMVGASLVSRQGRAEFAALQASAVQGVVPTKELAHGAMILVAGVLLLTPGFFTDGVGFLLLTPPVRAAAIRFARSRITHVHASVHMGGGFHRRPAQPGAGPGTVEGEYKIIDPDEITGPDGADEPGQNTPGGNSGWTRAPGEKRGD